MGCRSNTYRNTPPPAPILHTHLEGLKLLGGALIPFGFKWPKDWGERVTNNLLLDTKTKPNPQTFCTKDLIELKGRNNEEAIKKAIERASSKMRKDNLGEVDLTGAGAGYTLIKRGKGGHGGSHTFCRSKQTNNDI